MARVAPGGESLEDMVANLAGTVAALQSELKSVKAELRETKQKGTGDGPTAYAVKMLAKIKAAKDRAAAGAPPAAAAEVVQSITYAEAFELIGGEAELQKYAALSEELTASIDDKELTAELKRLLPRDYAKRTGFSTKLVNQPFCATLEQLYARANAVHDAFDDVVRDLAEKTSGRPLLPPVKGEVRARMKALFKYGDGKNVAWYRLTDLVRATIEYVDLAALYGGLKDVMAHFGADVKELNDRYQRPMAGGYRDIQLCVKFQNHMCELQLSCEPMTRAKMTTGHRDFEVIRELRAAVAKGDLSRVVNALEFGREHLGTGEKRGDGSAALQKLLRGADAATLPHRAARDGHAEILHAFLLHGADANARDEAGNTPLHVAVFYGHERCVWVLLDAGEPDLDATNAEGNTALVEGYLMLWQRPPEHAVRAVSTLAQCAGAARIRAARAVVDDQLKKRLKPSRQLVDHAACGNVDKMLGELKAYANPNSHDKDGQSVIEAAAANGQVEALEVLLDYKPAIPPMILTKIDKKVLKKAPKLIEVLEDAGLATIRCVGGPWPRGLVKTVPLVEGCQHYSDRKYTWSHVPPTLVGVMSQNPCHCNGVALDISSVNDTVGVLVAHSNRTWNDDYLKSVEALEVDLAAKGFERTTMPQMASNSFREPGVDIWELAPTGERRTVRVETIGDMELNLLLYNRELKLPCVCEVVESAGKWSRGPLKMTRLEDGAAHYTDREYVYDDVPEELVGCPMTINPCHGMGANLVISCDDHDVGVLIACGARNEYAAGVAALEELLGGLGFEKTFYFHDMRTNSFSKPGMDLWRKSVRGKGTVSLEVTVDVEFNVLSLPLRPA